MEAGWFGKNKNYVKKEVIVQNNHYLEENEKISSQLTSFRERSMFLERERQGLLKRVKLLESQLLNLN